MLFCCCSNPRVWLFEIPRVVFKRYFCCWNIFWIQQKWSSIRSRFQLVEICCFPLCLIPTFALVSTFLLFSHDFSPLLDDLCRSHREAFVSGAFAHDPRWRACRNATLEFWGIETVNELSSSNSVVTYEKLRPGRIYWFIDVFSYLRHFVVWGKPMGWWLRWFSKGRLKETGD